MIHDSYLKKSGRRFQHTVEGLKDNVKGVEKSMRSVKLEELLYTVSQRLQLNISLARKETAGINQRVSILYKIQAVKI